MSHKTLSSSDVFYRWCLWALIPLTGALIFFMPYVTFVDETTYYELMGRLIHFDFSLSKTMASLGANQEITVFPTYFYGLALLVKSLGIGSLYTLRLLHYALCLIATLFFYLLCREVDHANRWSKTLQFFIFPVIFPYRILFYTDVFSLGMVLASVFFALRKNLIWVCLFSLAAVAIRQSNIFWTVVPFGLLIDWKNASDWRKTLLSNRWTLFWLIGIWVAFYVFVVMSGNLLMGHRQEHAFKLRSGNVVFFLWLLFYCFLPFQIHHLFELIKSGFAKKNLLLLFLIGLMIYWMTFINDHPYNQADRSHWVRNAVLLFFVQNDWYRFVGYLICFFSAHWLFQKIVGSNRKYWVFVLLGAIFLLAHWPIEQRYSFFIFSIFLLIRPVHDDARERVFTVFLLLVSLTVYYRSMVRCDFFL